MTVGQAAPDEKRIFVQVPKDATPGSTKLRVAGDGSQDFIVTVPDQAGPEDLLILTEKVKEDGKFWQISIVTAESAKEFLAPIGGTFQRQQTLGEQQGLSTAPGVAEPPQQAPASGKAEESSHGAGDNISLYQVNVDPAHSFERLVEAARAAGGYVNEKLGRDVIPPMGMVGIVARGPIAKGEEIARIPSSLHICIKTVERVMPEFYDQVRQLKGLKPQFEKDIRVAACLTQFLAQAVERIKKRIWLELEGDAASLWAVYCDQLLGENFTSHPQWQWVFDAPKAMADMRPSPEGLHAEYCASETLSSFRRIKEGIPDHFMDPNFDAGLFLHARLSMLSRVFHTHPEYPSLVPVVDLFNHSPDPTCDWGFDADADAMVLTSNRAHAIGDQLWITYGIRPNPILFRAYGFTLPPSMEPSWSYILQMDKPADIYAKFLPAQYLATPFHMDTRMIQESLMECLNACAQGGQDAIEFVLALCMRLREDYEQDSMIQPALAALRRARSKLPASGAWWEELESGNGSESSAFQEACVNCKMSEYLCLTAHFEFCEFAAGRLPEDQCLEAATQVRLLMTEAFHQLKHYGTFKLQTFDVTSAASDVV